MWFLKAVKESFNFNGRSRRKEYWCFILISIIGSLLLTLVDGIFFGYTAVNSAGTISLLWSLFLIPASLSVTARRLHDIGMSGWWQLLYLIPLLGTLILFFFLIKKGDIEFNEFGLNPINEEVLD